MGENKEMSKKEATTDDEQKNDQNVPEVQVSSASRPYVDQVSHYDLI